MGAANRFAWVCRIQSQWLFYPLFDLLTEGEFYYPIVDNPSDDRISLVRALEVASRVLAIAIEMAVPAVLGYWLDHRFGLPPLFALLGGILGMTWGIWTLIRIAPSLQDRNSRKHPPDDGR
jgi:F0F1-type ATP synthase assembly protein I